MSDPKPKGPTPKATGRAAAVAKAGRRALPHTRGKHVTTPEARARGRWLSGLWRLRSDGFVPIATKEEALLGVIPAKPPTATRREFFAPMNL